MPRPYHSPSSLALGARCEAAWAWTYVAGLREPEISWEAIEAGAKWSRSQRATALGKAMHKIGEDWYSGRAPKWDSFPGRVFASGVHLLPQPSKCDVIEVERAVGTEPSGITEEGRPPTVLIVEGTRFAGFRDLVVRSPAETYRFGFAPPNATISNAWILLDYKSSANIARYAKTDADLLKDPQCNLYALDVMLRQGLPHIWARWVYFETKDVRRAKAVNVSIERQRAIDVLAALAPLAKRLDAIDDPAFAECNTDACGDYGGCAHHISAGGPCLARRSLGTLVQLKGRREVGMPINSTVREQFAVEIAKRAAPPAVVETTGEAVTAEAPVETPAVVATEAKRPRAPRKPKETGDAQVIVPQDTSSAPSAAGVATILRLSPELAEAQAALDVANTELEQATVRQFDAANAVAKLLTAIKEAI